MNRCDSSRNPIRQKCRFSLMETPFNRMTRPGSVQCGTIISIMETKDVPTPSKEKGKSMPHPTAQVPFFWRIRKWAVILTGPLIIVFCVFAWNLVPMREAKFQQKELANAFFKECTVVFTDTAGVPRIPDECLHSAQKKLSITTDALRSWAPTTSADIKDGYWYAHIQFLNPAKQVFDKKIGVAVNDVGYNTPSERSQHLQPDSVEP